MYALASDVADICHQRSIGGWRHEKEISAHFAGRIIDDSTLNPGVDCEERARKHVLCGARSFKLGSGVGALARNAHGAQYKEKKHGG